MSHSLTKRLQKELGGFFMNPIDGVSANCLGSDVTKWIATIQGPPDTPYFGHSYHLYLQFPPEYPQNPPKVLFISPIYHANIDFHGRICVDMLGDQWTSSMTAGSILVGLRSLLDDPNDASPLNNEAAELRRAGDMETLNKKIQDRYKPMDTADAEAEAMGMRT